MVVGCSVGAVVVGDSVEGAFVTVFVGNNVRENCCIAEGLGVFVTIDEVAL